MPYFTSMRPAAAIVLSRAESTVSTRDSADHRRPRSLMLLQMSATLRLLTMKLSSTIAKPSMS